MSVNGKDYTERIALLCNHTANEADTLCREIHEIAERREDGEQKHIWAFRWSHDEQSSTAFIREAW